MDIKCYKKGVSDIGFYTAKNGETPVWRDCYDESYGDVCVHVYTECEGETAQILRSDMNRDSRLTAADLSLMKQAIRQPERSDLYQPAADWNGDSEINNEDARGLLNYLLTASELKAEKFSLALPGVEVAVNGDKVLQKGKVNGQDYALTLDLSKWEQHTTQEQLVELLRLFWQCYPRMWARFADISDAPTEMTLAVENEGYEVAEAGGNHVHIHDQWLEKCPEDYDCITHELAHIIQNGWQRVYSGTQLAGKTIDEVWAMYSASEFANLSSYSDHGRGSELLAQYPIREKVKLLRDE